MKDETKLKDTLHCAHSHLLFPFLSHRLDSRSLRLPLRLLRLLSLRPCLVEHAVSHLISVLVVCTRLLLLASVSLIFLRILFEKG